MRSLGPDIYNVARSFLLTWLCISFVYGRFQPNIILFLVDDMGWKDPAFMGSDYHVTPHMDDLAARSMVFTNAYANAANCAPSRAALLSGMYAPRTGIYTVNKAERGERNCRRLIPQSNVIDLRADVVTLAEALKEANYTTAIVGKYHLGQLNSPTDPQMQGFDLNIAGSENGGPPSYFSPYRNPRLEDGLKGEYLTERLTLEAIRFIQQHTAADDPFFLYFSHFSVHTPIEPLPRLQADAKKRKRGTMHHSAEYAAMVESVDESLGSIYETLKLLGIRSQTIIVFASDNGGMHLYTRQDPLRDGKGSPYEGGSRVPLIVKWPNCTTPGSISDEPVLLFDLYPTLIDAAGGKLPTSQPVDGESLVPLLCREQYHSLGLGGKHRHDKGGAKDNREMGQKEHKEVEEDKRENEKEEDEEEDRGEDSLVKQEEKQNPFLDMDEIALRRILHLLHTPLEQQQHQQHQQQQRNLQYYEHEPHKHDHEHHTWFRSYLMHHQNRHHQPSLQHSYTHSDEPRALFWHFPAYLESYFHTQVDRAAKLTHRCDPLFRATPYSSIRVGHLKLIEFFEHHNELQLFNLTADPGERHDLAGSLPEEVQLLHSRLQAWRAALNATDTFQINTHYRPV